MDESSSQETASQGTTTVGGDEFARLGNQVAEVLRSAHASADAVREQAGRDADGARAEAHAEADRVRAEAEEVAARVLAAAADEAGKRRAEIDEEMAGLRSAAETDREAAALMRLEAEAEAERIVAEANDRAERVLAGLREREGDARAHIDGAIDHLRTIRTELNLFAGGGPRLDLDDSSDAAVAAEHGTNREAAAFGEAAGKNEVDTAAVEEEREEVLAEGDETAASAPPQPEKEPVPPVRDPSQARQAGGDDVGEAVKVGVARAVSGFFAGKRGDDPGPNRS